MDNVWAITAMAILAAFLLYGAGKALQHGARTGIDHLSGNRAVWAVVLTIILALVFGVGWLLENAGPDAVRDSVPKPPVNYQPYHHR